ncbi:hypothetical protein HPB51_028664 [Rhipicephalus microplus]|uniref:Uncharacterized protein n=1 Tax=Rhipicephalus microplus TaxID=6941 RepID=A0A9J6CWA6_RHIMP|nr:hypothetical protein HPB51_028664 [Rhipicephalus microplus]
MARTDGSDPTLTDRADSLESCLTNAAFDRQMLPPCTATAESACQLVDHLSMLNEVLFWAEIELRETPETCGELHLASFANKNTNIQNDAGKTSRAICLFLWLLKAHACIYYVKIHYGVLVAYGRIICDALNCSHSVRALIIDIGASVVNKHVDDALCSLKRLDLLVCLAVSLCDELWFSLPKVIRIHSSLTTLNISELRLRGSRAQDLVAALKENSTLKELSIHGSVVCDAGRGVFTKYLKTNTSLITRSVGEDDVSNRNCFNWIVEGLLVNEVIKNLSLTNILFDRVNATLAARIFSENKTIRSFHGAYFPQALFLQPDTDYHLWLAPLSNNDTL